MNDQHSLESGDRVEALLQRHKPGYSLEQAFYTDLAVFERDLQHVFFQRWIFVGHHARIPCQGDYFLAHLAETTLIIVRGPDNEIRALVNICRHRGTPVCTQEQGNARRFACPYHAWVYDTSGQLLHAGHMGESFDPSAYRLRRATVRVVQGMIFASLAEHPPDLEPAIADLTPYLKPHGLDSAQIAHREIFTMESNWKLALENYLECYHCPVAHPEYTALHDDDNEERLLEWLQQARDSGYKVGGIGREWLASPPSVEGYGVTRAPLRRGFQTSSRDGKPIAPLMGTMSCYDGGQTYFAIGPVSFGVADSDHAIILSFLPRSPTSTQVDMVWLVAAGAQEGRDYELARLLWLWRPTMLQDVTVVGAQQQGIRSRFYQPGPYSLQEGQLRRWSAWYLEQLRQESGWHQDPLHKPTEPEEGKLVPSR